MRNRGEGETVSPIQIKTHAYKYNNKNNHHKANTECDYEKQGRRRNSIGKRSQLRMGKRLLMPSPIRQTGAPICRNFSVNFKYYNDKHTNAKTDKYTITNPSPICKTVTTNGSAKLSCTILLFNFPYIYCSVIFAQTLGLQLILICDFY